MKGCWFGMCGIPTSEGPGLRGLEVRIWGSGSRLSFVVECSGLGFGTQLEGQGIEQVG